MADEPVSAFPESTTRRLARWARRNAALVTGAGAILATAVIALAGITGLVTQQNTRLEQARGEAARQKEQAVIGKTMAARAVQEMLDEVARKDLLNVPQAEGLRVKLAERAVAFYRDFDKHQPNDPETRFELARVEEEVASLYRMIGKYDRATQEYAVAVASLRGLIANDPGKPRYRDFLANTENQIGEMIKLRGGTDAEAEPHYREAVRLTAGLRRDFPSVPRYHSLAARTHNDFASMLTSAGRHDESEPLAREAAESAVAYRATLPAEPDPKQYMSDWVILPMSFTTHGAVLSKLGRRDDAEVALRQAIDALRGLLKIYPDANDLQFLLADALKEVRRHRSAAIPRIRRPQALAALDEGVILMTPLVNRFPLVVFYARYLAILRGDRGATRLAADQLDQAHDDLAYAQTQLSQRVQREKNALEPIQQLGKVKGSLARLAAGSGRAADARSMIGEAIDLQQKALVIDPVSRVDHDLLEQHRAFQKSLGGR